MGRRNLVRFARFLYDGSRLDVNNNMDTNGEISVQKNIIENTEKTICAFDVGANVGLWTNCFLQIAKNSGIISAVHAFEPCRSTHKTLIGNLEKWNIKDCVITSEIALSSSVGERNFYSIGSDAGKNGFYPITNSQGQDIQKVQTDTVDNYCAENAIAKIDVIKIDTEGHDLEIILGAKNMLSSGAVDFIQFEYNHRWISAKHFLLDAFEYLLPLGYSIGKITPKGIEFYSAWHHELESFKEANYLAVRNPLKSIFPQINWWNNCLIN